MFAKNSVFKVSGDFDERELLVEAIDMCVKLSGKRKLFENKRLYRPTYQITSEGYLCIGYDTDEGNYWKEMPCYYDPNLLADIAIKHVLEYQDNVEVSDDGVDKPGFLLELMDEENTKSVIAKEKGIFLIKPYSHHYDF